MIDYEPYTCPNPEYDTTRIELAIDCDSGLPTIRARIGRCIVLCLDGIYYVRKTEDDETVLIQYEKALEE